MLVCRMRLPWEELEPARHALVEKQRQAVNRVEQFAACVFAISIALLVFHLAVPQLTPAPTEAVLQRSLLAMYPSFYACALSFIVLLMYWVLHHIQFHYLTHSSGRLVWLNALMLAFVALFPFSTALVSTYAMTKTAVLLYEANIFAIQLLLALSWKHAVQSGLLFGGDTPSRVVHRMKTALGIGIVYLLVTMGLVFISPFLSMRLLIVLAIYYIVLTARGGYALELIRRHPPQDL